jgi:hypothetical protein
MPIVTNGGYFGDTLGVNGHANRIAQIPAGCWLHHVKVQGAILLEYVQVALSTTTYPLYNLAAGIQYGAAGYTAVVLTDATQTTQTWVTYGELLPAEFTIANTPGVSPQTVMERVSYGINLRWRGTRYFAAATDLYFVSGQDIAFGGNPPMKNQYTWETCWTN